MFGGHWYELIIALVVALVIFGPRRLPEIGATFGAGIRELRRATSGERDRGERDDRDGLAGAPAEASREAPPD